MSGAPSSAGMRMTAGFSTGRSQAAQALLPIFLLAGSRAGAQAPVAAQVGELTQQVARLAALVSQQGQQLQQSQAEILALGQKLAAMQAQLAASSPGSDAPQGGAHAEAASELARQVALLREQQDVQSSQIATHEQAKAESASKYPLKLTGLILANGFHNASGVDMIQAPTLAVGGSGATGISLRQTILGLDARGPHVFGAASFADVRADFFGDPASGASGGYSDAFGLLRLRTAHASLHWAHAQAFAELDHPLFSPDTPTSLTAVAEPALAWSGYLWNWLPQVGGEYDRTLSAASSLSLQAALLDVPDPPLYTVAAAAGTATTTNLASSAEQSSRPGSELHLAYAKGDTKTGVRFGAGGYFSPHGQPGSSRYDAWAATLDYRVPISRHFEAGGGAYRGLALGGLGGGAYKDDVPMFSSQGQYVSRRPLDDVGGWSQLKARTGQHLEFNIDFGLDNAFASEARPYALSAGGSYADLIRNATFFSNAVYSPTAYTLFSFEYRRLNSTPAIGSSSTADVYGLAAGYKF